jgi:hypothetical protein
MASSFSNSGYQHVWMQGPLNNFAHANNLKSVPFQHEGPTIEPVFPVSNSSKILGLPSDIGYGSFSVESLQLETFLRYEQCPILWNKHFALWITPVCIGRSLSNSIAIRFPILRNDWTVWSSWLRWAARLSAVERHYSGERVRAAVRRCLSPMLR